MKISAQREVLLQPISQVIGVVERRQTLPVLSNLLVEAKEGELSLTATDLEVELVSRANVDIDDGGEVTIPGRKLYDICRALPDGTEVKLEVSGDKARIQAGRSRFTLATLPATEFPVIDDVEAAQTVTIPREALQVMIDKTAFAMAQQDVRYYLNGMLLDVEPGQLKSVATDGHRLAICEHGGEVNVDTARQIIVPRKGVLELGRLLADGEDEVELQLAKNHLRIDFGRSRLTTKLIDGRFPDYQAVIPVGADREISADRASLRQALQRVAILSNEKYRGVRLEISSDVLEIKAHNPDQEEAHEEVEIDSDVDDLAVGFNVNYLLDALNALDDDNVVIQFRDAASSCLIRSPDSDQVRHVVMPLRL